MVFAIPALAFAGPKNSANFNLDQTVKVAGTQLAPGQYDCQITVLDPSGHKAAFWRAPVKLVP